MQSLAIRYAELIRQIPQGVDLLAVSKGHPAAAIRILHGLGQRSFGESRWQEAAAKQGELADLSPIDWHFIGRLQANKVRAVLKGCSTIHGIDSLALAQRISRVAVEEARTPRLYVQLKLLPDPQKGGFEPEQLPACWPELQQLPGVIWQGVMAIPPLGLGEQELRTLYCQAAAWADQLGLMGRSMGMSSDWPLAVACGSSLVRLGSALFGAKP
jgi:pyridoxal phosphate enzyme (YggS family)